MGEFKRFFYLILVGIWAFFVSCGVSAQENGATPWVELPFGKMRLMSCREGIKNHPIVVGGLQIQINEGWLLKKPHLKTLDEKMPLWVEYPIRPDFQETRFYQDDLFIPLVGSALSKDAVFGVQGALEGCRRQNDCLKLPIQFQLPLSDTSKEYTGYCAFIMDQMNQVPLLQPKKLKAFIKNGQDHQTELVFAGIKGVNQAFLQNDSGIQFETLEREFLSDGVRFLVSVSEKSPNPNWILITNKGIFRVDHFSVLQKDKDLTFAWGKLLFGGFLLFLCSPLFFWWGLSWPKKKDLLPLQSAQMAEQATYMILLWGLFSAFLFPEIQSLFYHPVFLWTLLGVLIFILIVPPKNPWLIGGLFLIYPKPYLNGLLEVFSAQKSLWVVGIVNFILWAWLLFWFRSKWGSYLEKKIQKGLKKACFRMNLFFLLPTLILTIIVGRTLTQSSINFSNQFYEGINVVCTAYTSECSKWQNEKVNLIESTSLLGQTLLKKYAREGETLVILNTPTEKTIFSEGISPKEVKNFMTDWRNYRVLGRPKNQPIHFGDDRHAPLPNAK